MRRMREDEKDEKDDDEQECEGKGEDDGAVWQKQLDH